MRNVKTKKIQINIYKYEDGCAFNDTKSAIGEPGPFDDAQFPLGK